MKKFILFAICILTFSVESTTANASESHHTTAERPIEFHHDWNFNRLHKRSHAKPLCTAILTDSFLSFSFFAPIENAKIEITKDGIPVFSEIYSKLDVSLEIQLSEELEEGDYVIAITNNDGLNLFGNFKI